MLLGIAVKSGKRVPMQEVAAAEVTTESGIVGDWRGDGGAQRKRQITILSRDPWQIVCQELNHVLPWTTRRANLFIDDFVFNPQDKGASLFIGEKIQLMITGETEPCKRMDEAYPGLRQALTPNWRAGVTCRVIRGGTMRVGDQIRHEPWKEPLFPGDT